MPYPTATDINNAVRYPQLIKDPFLQDASIILSSKKLPEYWSGGFSQVFTFMKGETKWAFKVWHKEIPNNRERYSHISNHLKKHPLPYLSQFEYVENGIFINDMLYDTFRMEWIEGTTLVEYISLHLKNKTILKKLAEDFLIMAKSLHSCGISHGDLHHDNIFVKSNGELKLIDYDSLCVPALEGIPDFCRGRSGFQHPTRHSAVTLTTTTKVDFFSELIIYLSIKAVIECPTLWETYQVAGSNSLLFTYGDFLRFDESEIRKDLISLSSPEIDNLVKALEKYLPSYLTLESFVT